jgi:hypothetical protein
VMGKGRFQAAKRRNAGLVMVLDAVESHELLGTAGSRNLQATEALPFPRWSPSDLNGRITPAAKRDWCVLTV